MKPVNFTREQVEILSRVVKDPLLFSTFIYVINPIHGKVRFDLYPYQKSTLLEFLRHRFNIVLKGRQMGVTELISMLCLWIAMYHKDKKIQIISIKEQVAKKVLRKIKYMYKNLPHYLQTPIINGRTGEFGTSSEIVFSTGSFIESLPASENAGRSEALTLLIMDEAAMIQWASTIWASAAPTLSCAVYDTPIMVRTEKKRDTEIIDLGSICPKNKGVMDISHLGLKTLTHNGTWEDIKFAQNKGKLETWYVRDDHGKVNGFTPAHRLYTTKGWKTVKEIIEKDLNIISVETKVEEVVKPPKVRPPKRDILKPIEGFEDYLISNQGRVFKKTPGGIVEVTQRANKCGYLRVGLTNGTKRNTGNKVNQRKDKLYQRTVSVLVAEAFIGPKKKGYQVDHINCDKECNHVNNLRYVTNSENVTRTFDHNINAKLGGLKFNKKTLRRMGRLLELHSKGYSPREIGKKLYKDRKAKHSKHSVERVLNERGTRVYISKLEVIKKSKEYIYDIHVENYHSYISANNFINHNTGGSAIINSTPLGIGNFFHSTWQEAILGSNGINPIRLHWQMHPDRNQEWYENMAKALGPKRTAQEIDGDFLSSGNTVFDLTDIRAIEEMLQDYPAVNVRLNGQFREFGSPVRGEEYFIGADVSTGRATDYSAFSLMDKEGEEWGCFKGRISTSKFAKLLGDTGKKWNFATLAPETNDVGLAVTACLQDEGYPNLYYSEKMLRKKGERRSTVEQVPGWLTSSKNRTTIIDGLEKDIREGHVIIKDPFFPPEAYTFIYDASNRPVAMGKHKKNSSVDVDIEGEVYSDDAIFGKSITNHIRKKPRKDIIILPY